jgi:MFS family permease
MDESRAVGESALRKAGRRLIPVMVLCYFFAYLDRTNLSVASLTMNESIGLSASAYGLGAGLLFLGYVSLEVPSNLMLHKVGARIWMCRIMVTWGVVASAGALIQGEKSFYLLRLLLGLAEAGFFPGMILYLTYWFPAAQRARVTAQFMIAVPLSSALGSPLSGLLLKLHGLAGLEGWQWLFVIEGLPSVVLGVMLLWLLPDRPAAASWLTPGERTWITSTLAAEESAVRRGREMTVRQSLGDKRVLGLSVVYFALAFGLYGLGFWMPQIIKKSLDIQSDLRVSLLTALPYALGAVAMVIWGRRCDRGGQTPGYTALPMVLGGVVLAGSALLTESPWLGYGGLCVCSIGIMAAFPAFWSLPSGILAGVAAASGIAVINTLGNVAGFVGSYWMGWMTDLFGDSRWALVTVGAVMSGGGLLVLKVGSGLRHQADPKLLTGQLS